MKLTGKCKEDFYKYLDTQPVDELLICFDVSLNALIIEFFDSVGLFIGVHPNMYNKFLFFINKEDTYKQWRNDLYYNTRIEATNSAIEYLNQLYNNPIAY